MNMSRQPTIDALYKKAFENMERLEVEEAQNTPSEDEVMEVESGKRKREVPTNAEEELDSQSDTAASKDSKRSRSTLESQSPTAQKKSNTEKPMVIPNRESQKHEKSTHVTAPQKAKSNAPIPDSESSEDEDEDDWEAVPKLQRTEFPKPDPELKITSSRVMSLRFSMVIKYPLPLTIEKQMILTFKKLNNVLTTINGMVEGKGLKGKTLVIPWEDEVVYENRGVSRFEKNWFYDEKKIFKQKMAKMYLSTFIHKWSTVPRKILDLEFGEPATKWFDVQLAWVGGDEILPDLPSRPEWAKMVSEAAMEIEGISLTKALTQVKEPITAVQFLNSVINPAGDWMEEGHARAFRDLTQMVSQLLGDKVEFGLATRKIDCGTYSKQHPRVVTVTVDASMVSKVQLELATIFSKENTKKNKIVNGVYTNWIAVPTFSSIATSRDDSKVGSYSALLAQEKSFQKMIRTATIKGVRIENVDSPATESRFHLSSEHLQQMEDDLIKQGYTPIRRLVYDKVFKETKQRLIQARIQRDHPDMVEDTAALEEEIKKISDTMDFMSVAEEMQRNKIQSPFSTKPTPRPSKMSLRQMLLSLKSRTFPGEKVMLFDSVTVTDEGELLVSFHSQVSAEAQTVAELLPCFIQHEMHIDPQFYCLPSLLQDTLGSVYNPVSRKGFLSKLKNTIVDQAVSPSPRFTLPEFCREFSAQELVRVFKCPIYAGVFPSSNEDDLVSLAESIATSPPVRLHGNSQPQVDQIMQEAKTIQTIQMEEMSGLSGNSFDSKTSQNAFFIEERAEFKVKNKFMDKVVDHIRRKQYQVADTIMQVGEISVEELKEQFPDEAEEFVGASKSEEEVTYKPSEEVVINATDSSAMDLSEDQQSEEQEESPMSSEQDESSMSSEQEDMSVSSQLTEVAGSPSKGTGGLNPGCHT